MIKNITKSLLSTGLALFLLNCSNDSGDNKTSTLPTSRLTCSQDFVSTCTASQEGKTFFIGFSPDLSIDCASTLSSKNLETELYFEFIASSTGSVNFDSATLNLRGSVLPDQYVSELGSPLFSLENRTYRVCGFIDNDDNDFLSFNEPILTQTIELLDINTLPLDQWDIH